LLVGVGASTRISEIPFAITRTPTQRFAVSTAQEIKSAIEQLPLAERAALIADLCGWAEDDWDRQMKADAAAGKFAALNEDAATAYRSGQTQPLDDILDKS
jgi:hypothetical protein